MTDDPTPEELVAASHELDERVASSDDLATLRRLIDDHQKIISNQDRQTRRLTILSYVVGALALIATVIASIGLSVILDVERNSKEIDRTQEAIAVYCAQTNVYNDEAHRKFLDLFPNPDSRQRVEAIADVAWPHRTCTVKVPATTALFPTSSPPTDVTAP